MDRENVFDLATYYKNIKVTDKWAKMKEPSIDATKSYISVQD